MTLSDGASWQFIQGQYNIFKYEYYFRLETLLLLLFITYFFYQIKYYANLNKRFFFLFKVIARR